LFRIYCVDGDLFVSFASKLFNIREPVPGNGNRY